MRRPTIIILIACSFLGAGGAPAAHAAWFPAAAIDGPSPDIAGIGGVDLARDGVGALVWRKRVAGVPHVFLARLSGGAWGAPEQVDAGIAEGADEVAVAVADEHRLVVVWISGDRLYGAFTGSGGGSQPLRGPVLLYDAPAGALGDLALDMGINGTAYAVFRVPGGGGGDVNAVRLQGDRFEGLAEPLDIDPARGAGSGGGRARVAVSADGNAIVAWGEAGRVYARRLTGLTPSRQPQEISVGAEDADLPDIDVEEDGSFAWAALRQWIGGVPRTIARRLVGSAFEGAATLDGGVTTGAPRVAINGRGQGLAVAPGPGGAVFGSYVDFSDVFGPIARLDATGGSAAAEVAAASSDRRETGVVWRRESANGDAAVYGRFKPDELGFEPEVLLSTPALGPVVAGSLVLASDRTTDIAVAMLQGTESARSVVVAVYDDPPGKPFMTRKHRYLRSTRPLLKWSPSTDLWGRVGYRVAIDGVEVGTSTDPRFRPPSVLPEGAHRVRITAVDQRGQSATSRERVVRVDKDPPNVVSVRIGGGRKPGGPLRFVVKATDGGSGVARFSVDYGDGSERGASSRTTHRYARKGRYRVSVRVYDEAGNVARARVRLRIR